MGKLKTKVKQSCNFNKCVDISFNSFDFKQIMHLMMKFERNKWYINKIKNVLFFKL